MSNFRPISNASDKRRQGFTLIELTIAGAMFLGLLGLLLFTNHQSMRAMLKGTTQSDFLQSTQVLAKMLSRHVQFASPASLSLAADGSGMAFLSAENDQGDFQFDPALSQAIWQKYQILYWDSTEEEIRQAEQDVRGFPEQTNPGPIENWDAAQPIETYFTDGKPVLRNVTSATFLQPSPATIELDVILKKERALSQGPETYKFRLVRNLRN